jgi:DnaA family protein
VSQLVLPLRLADHAVFATFLNTGNEALLGLLGDLARSDASGGNGCWLWGAPSTGKTHLLQAACECADERSIYLPMRLLSDAGPGVLEGLASRDLVCIDDIEQIVGDDMWERALFNLCNDITDADSRLIVAASASPRECPIALPDLESRLSRLPTFHLHPLAEADRAAALQLRARHRGLDLPSETARYLLSRSRRDMGSLYSLLDKLDLEALRAKRRLTIPFVRAVMKESSTPPR